MKMSRLKGVPTFSWATLARECGLEHPPPMLAGTSSGNSKGDRTDGDISS